MELINYNKRKLVNINPAKDEHIIHDNKKCTSCENCMSVCSMNLWVKRDNKVELAENYKMYCLECASCFIVCDTGAVNFTFPEGGFGVIYAHG